MDRDRFWELVGAVRTQAGSSIDDYEKVLRSQLSDLSPEELASFDHHFHQLVDAAYRWKLWAAAYLINGGCSDDGFYYFRGWLVVQGKEIYGRALKDPDSLADICTIPTDEVECEEVLYLYVARDLYEESTGREVGQDWYQNDNPMPDEPKGEPWEEEDLPALLPRLAKIHWHT
jgi:hypothetical protein